ncbi:LCP family protein [Paenibacillus dokdonensis]|uniref:LCP family protein n=1 Tax=Paenibacillus dokdonensis TaxID=2567944 RepID=A0ABU6GSE3_9BACL|nr:LCP family protein [Paenibacillus dokdonensis]MEC0241211.1 LCP family protein [Paenibacillus dokdonensis]
MARPKKKKNIYRTVIWSFVSVIGLFILIAGSYAGFLHHKAMSAVHKISAAEYQAPQHEETKNAIPVTENVTEEDMKPMTILLAGVDNREGSGGTMNTDVMMLVTLNPETKSASLLSIPRDLKITPAGQSSHKANYFYAHNYIKDKSTAMTETKQLIGDLFHLPIDYMVLINFDGFRQAVDAVGGFDVDVDMDMHYMDTADGTNINLTKGLQHLDGKETLDFVRYRKSNDGTSPSSDFDRNKRQQQVLSQMLDKLTSLNGISQWGSILDIIGDNVKTDIPEKSLTRWLLNFKKMKPDTTNLLTVEGDWKSPFVYWNKDDLTKAMETLYSNVDLKPKGKIDYGEHLGLYTNSYQNKR